MPPGQIFSGDGSLAEPSTAAVTDDGDDEHETGVDEDGDWQRLRKLLESDEKSRLLLDMSRGVENHTLHDNTTVKLQHDETVDSAGDGF